MENPAELLTPVETAKALRVSVWTLQHWRKSATPPLPHVRIGGRIRYRRADVDHLITGRYQTIFTQKAA